MATYQRCRFSSRDARSPRSSRRLQVLLGRVEVALLAQDVGEADVQVTGGGQQRSGCARRPPARARSSRRASSGRPRASHMWPGPRSRRARRRRCRPPAGCATASVKVSTAVVEVARGPGRQAEEARRRRPGRGGRRVRPASSARRACATVPSTSPRAWATDGAVDRDHGRQRRAAPVAAASAATGERRRRAPDDVDRRGRERRPRRRRARPRPRRGRPRTAGSRPGRWPAAVGGARTSSGSARASRAGSGPDAAGAARAGRARPGRRPARRRRRPTRGGRRRPAGRARRTTGWRPGAARGPGPGRCAASRARRASANRWW